MDCQKLFVHITDHYSAKLLNWAVKKTGNRQDGEDLASEVMCQVFLAISKGEKIVKLEHFIWKVAHYVWCNHLRILTREKNRILWDEKFPDINTPFDETLAEKESLDRALADMRRKMADLSYLKRKAMILHYLDGLSISEVAKALSITQSAVKWHLFDARKMMKEELSNMKDSTSYVYRPGRLSLGLSGISGPDPDIKKVNSSLVKQNICLLCYKGEKTIDELCEYTGIPKPYLEYDLNWLVEREFLTLKGNRYSTNFVILGRKHSQEIGAMYYNTRNEYIDKIIAYLEQREKDIRQIGFYGCDFPYNRLLWSIIMLFTSYFSRNAAACVRLKKKDDRAIRPDGGRYYVFANDLSDEQEVDPNGYFKPEGWNGYNGNYCCELYPNQAESVFWLGIYNFKDNMPQIADENNIYDAQHWHKLFCALIEPDFDASSLNDNDKEKLAEAVQNGMVIKKGSEYKPQFVIMTFEQHERLKNEIFAPLLDSINGQVENFSERIESIHKRTMPKQTKGYIDYFTYMDLYDTGIYTLILAAMENKLHIPKTADEGTPLTLVVMH